MVVHANYPINLAGPDRRLRSLSIRAFRGELARAAEHTVATTAAEQAALKKLVANWNWRALIEQRPTMPLFEGKEV